jgi:hypothetical protein
MRMLDVLAGGCIALRRSGTRGTNRVLSRSDGQFGYSVAARKRVTAGSANVASGFSCMRLF